MYGEIVTRLRYKPAELKNTALTINGTKALLSIDPTEIPFPVLSDYEYCTIFLESFENNKDILYEVKYEIHYKWNNLLYKIGEVTSVDGKAEFPRLIKGLTYYITAIPLDGKYQSKQVRITLDEYDIRQEPVALTTYENTDYKKYDHHMILKNVFGDATVYLDGNPDYISLDRNDKNLRVYLNKDATERASEFDLVIEDYRIEDIVTYRKKILVNDGFSTPYNISIEFTDSNAAIFKWSTDGIYEINKFYISDNIINKGTPIDVIGTSTYIITNYDNNKTQYLWLSSIRDGKEKISDPITIDAVDDNFFNVDLLMLPAAPSYPSTLFTDLSIYKNTISNLNNNVRIVNDGTQYFDFPTTGCSVKTNTTIKNNMDFTAEAFVKLTANPTQQKYILQLGESSSDGSMSISFDNTRKLWATVIHNSQYVGAIVANSALEINKWEHVCLIRKSNKLYLFLNGNLLGTDVNYANKAIQSTSLYIGTNSPSIVVGASFNGFMKSIRISNFIRYNLTGFDVPNYEFPKYTSISKPTKIEYSIKDNNDLHVDIIHESNNVDNYSVYLEENEITTVTGLTPIATSTSKNIVIPNFDVYNNYDRTLKLLATTNKYNHSYLSDNKDLYVAYDWTPDKLSVPPKLWLSSENVITDANNFISQVNDLSSNNYNANQTEVDIKPKLVNNAIQFDGINDYLNIKTEANDIFRNVNKAWVFAVFSKQNIDDTNKERAIILFTNGATGAYRVGLNIGQATANKNIMFFGGRRLDDESYSAASMANNVIAGKIYIVFGYIDYSTNLIQLYVDGSLVGEKTNAFTSTGNTSDTSSKVIRLGSNGASPPSQLGDINIYTTIINNTQINLNQRQQLEGWAAHKYGLTDNLPVDHPYKNRRPIIDHTPINLTVEFKND